MIEHYNDLTRLIERLHRRYLDVVRAGLTRLGIDDVNPVQALMLRNIGGDEVVVRDLVERGYYVGSNASYNIKKLVDGGYLEQERSPFDRRSVRISLTPKGLELREKIAEIERASAASLGEDPGFADALAQACRLLRRIERTWADYLQYGPV